MNPLTKRLAIVAFLLPICALSACDPFVSEEAFSARFDLDGDGVPRPEDCDDNDPSVTVFYFYRDLDNDGYGAGEKVPACTLPEGMTETNTDCNDANDKMHPNSIEVCDQLDNDCDGETDEGHDGVWYQDKDGDGKGNPEVSVSTCIEPPGHVANKDDCDDTNKTTYIGAEELCDDDIDNDCDGVTDNAPAAVKQYLDDDDDDAGQADIWIWACEDVEGYSYKAGDCNDKSNQVGPHAKELCNNNVDDDCDGETDTDAEMLTWYKDGDNDNFGDENETKSACEPPDGYVANKTDCDDTDKDVNPSKQEVCNNGKDDDCSGGFNDCVLSGNVSMADPAASIAGATNNQRTGEIVISCDLNNDGQKDVVVGSSGFGDNRGRVDIYFANVSGAKTTDNSNIRILGEVGKTEFGSALACGDSNGDNKDDLLVGAPRNSGNAYLFHGPLVGPEIQATASVTQFQGGTNSSRLGASVAFMPKLNANNHRGVALGVPGLKNPQDSGKEPGGAVVFTNPGAGTLQQSSANATFVGVQNFSFTGDKIVAADFNGDTITDLAISSPFRSTMQSAAGSVYVVFGPFQQTEQLNLADAIWDGPIAQQHAGDALCSADFNGDGKADLVVGAFGNENAPTLGGAYLVLAPFQGAKSLALAQALFSSGQNGDWFGRSVACGDVNHDEKPDILIGAPKASVNGNFSGAIYGFNNNAAGQVNPANALFTIQGPGINQSVGENLSLSTDVTGDGHDDILIGSPGASMTGIGWIIKLLGL